MRLFVRPPQPDIGRRATIWAFREQRLRIRQPNLKDGCTCLSGRTAVAKAYETAAIGTNTATAADISRMLVSSHASDLEESPTADSPSEMPLSARLRSPTFCHRSSGSFARQFSISRCNATEQTGCKDLIAAAALSISRRSGLPDSDPRMPVCR